MYKNKCFLRVKKMEHFKGDLPEYQTPGSSGFDIRAQLSAPITIQPGNWAVIPTGLCFALDSGFELQVRPRSGLAAKHGITVLNAPGTIDSDYRGEVKVILINLSKVEFTIDDQDRCAQLVLAPVIQAHFQEVNSYDETSRGLGGFGSTGKK